ncbi:MAG: 50S ribosomal protein L30 [Acetobacteraceae bacterium]|nr:50S ribosomal protein L30 [Acetobacteraceae bacterium]
MAARLRITLVRSPVDASPSQRATVRSLGLRRLHQAVERDDGPETRGAVRKVAHLVRVEEIAVPEPRTRGRGARR